MSITVHPNIFCGQKNLAATPGGHGGCHTNWLHDVQSLARRELAAQNAVEKMASIGHPGR